MTIQAQTVAAAPAGKPINNRNASQHKWRVALKHTGGSCCNGQHLRGLSWREREMFFLIILGRSIRQSATEMGIEAKTAENYRYRVLAKLGVSCAVEAVHFAVSHGYLAAAGPHIP